MATHQNNSSRSVPQDLTGRRVGRLVVVRRSDKKVKRAGVIWVCVCDCGNTTEIRAGNLTNGHTRSCGCLQRETLIAIAAQGTHRRTGTREYRIWSTMIDRCHRPRTKAFKNYGGRGIKVCDRWRNSFVAFYADMGPIPEGHSLDRVDNDGNYEPGNCRWATQVEQMNNTRCNRWIEVDGLRLTLIQWSRRTGIKSATIGRRLKCGWPPEKAVSAPLWSRK